MKQWDIYLFPFTQERPHPAVVLSHDDRCDRCEQVNVLICSSARLNRAPAAHEIVLDEADGLDWKTACRCDVIYLLPKASFREKRGHVSPERQRQIARKLNECLRLKPWLAFGESLTTRQCHGRISYQSVLERRGQMLDCGHSRLEFCSAHGETPDEALREVHAAKKAWVASARAHKSVFRNRPTAARFIPERFHYFANQDFAIGSVVKN